MKVQSYLRALFFIVFSASIVAAEDMRACIEGKGGNLDDCCQQRCERDHKKEKKSLEDEIDRLRKENRDLTAERDRLKNEKKDWEKERRDLKKDIEDLEHQLKICNNRPIENCDDKVKAAKDKLEREKEEEIKRLKEEYERKLKNAETDCNKKIQDERDACNRKTLQLEQEKDDCKNKYTLLKKQYDTTA